MIWCGGPTNHLLDVIALKLTFSVEYATSMYFIEGSGSVTLMVGLNVTYPFKFSLQTIFCVFICMLNFTLNCQTIKRIQLLINI